MKIRSKVMEWLASSCYAGSLVLYLVVKFYYENEARKPFVYSGCDCCVCCREQPSHPPVDLPRAPARALFYQSSRGPSFRVPSHRLLHPAKGHARARRQYPRGES